MTSNLFKPYTQMPARLPPLAWRLLRWCSVACALGLIVTAVVAPSLGLRLFWGLYVPLLPLVFLIAPGLWRNVCPMAALNQIPRTLGFTRGLTLPTGVQHYTPLISAGLFLLIVPSRKVLLDHNGVALALFLVAVLALAFAGGVVFKGKSGWCTQFCPMLPVERFYGQSPLLVVRNSHCRPCVGCSKNCYDFNPTAAYLADLHDESPRLTTNRKLFAGAFPWVIAAFGTQPYLTGPGLSDVLALYGRLLAFAVGGIGVFIVLEAVSALSTQKLVLLHVVAAINVFYLFIASSALGQFGITASLPAQLIQAGVAVLSVVWLRRAWPRERAFLSSAAAAPSVAERVLHVNTARRAEQAEVVFTSGPTVLARGGETLLNIAEANGIALPAGCRMGACGIDPVRILAGAGNLSAPTATERGTLDVLGLDVGCRLACSARVHGPVTVSATPGVVAAGADHTATPGRHAAVVTPGVDRVVVIGAGVAGVTAAVELSKLAPSVHVTLIGAEYFDFYNRMAINRIVGEMMPLDSLYLMPREWAASRGVTYLRGVRVQRIERAERRVVTEEGESLPYDRLVLATGARTAVPPVEGYGMGGTFSLRTIDDAVAIQRYIQEHACRSALVVGGVLALEAGYSMRSLGLHVSVLDRRPWPLHRQLDEAAGTLLRQMLRDLGMDMLANTHVHRFIGGPRLQGVELADGRALAVDLCLMATGIAPEVDLARAAGLEVRRGIVIDGRMMTSDPAIYAAGDAAEYEGRIVGLWPTGMAQARVAAANLLGGDLRYRAMVPPMKLKVAGIDVLSVGEAAADGTMQKNQRELRFPDEGGRTYRKLVLQGERLVGAILIGYPDLADAICRAVEEQRDVRPLLGDLERGDWSVLQDAPLDGEGLLAPRGL